MYASEGFFEYNWLTIFIFYDIMRSGAIILRWRLLSQIYEGGFFIRNSLGERGWCHGSYI